MIVTALSLALYRPTLEMSEPIDMSWCRTEIVCGSYDHPQYIALLTSGSSMSIFIRQKYILTIRKNPVKFRQSFGVLQPFENHLSSKGKCFFSLELCNKSVCFKRILPNFPHISTFNLCHSEIVYTLTCSVMYANSVCGRLRSY